ncbi:MAG: lysozyme [Aeromonadaceae bacterium]
MNLRNLVIPGTSAMLLTAAMVLHFESSNQVITEAYLDPVGIPTICDGITKGVYIGMRVTKEWCDKARENEITNHSRPLTAVEWDLPPHIKAAFTDLAFNIGERGLSKSTPLRKLKAGDVTGACDGILLYKYAGGKDCSVRSNGCYGIWDRRLTERRLCRNEISVRDAQMIFYGLPVGVELE